MEYLTQEVMPYVVKLVPLLINGMKITIFVSILAFAISIVMGVILAIIQHYHVAILDPIAKVYISYFRGTPLLIQLFLFFYGLPMVMDIMVRCPKILALIICLAMNSAAYMAETIRGAIESVDKGQYEACLGFGMTHTQTMTRVVLPQAAVAAIPPIVNSAIGMTIGIQDVMGEAQLSAAVSYKTFETYIIAAAFYWILALILGKIQRIVERKIGVAYQK